MTCHEQPKKRARPKPPQGDFMRGDWLWPGKLDPRQRFIFTVPHRPPSLNILIRMKANRTKYGQAEYDQYREGWERCIRHYWIDTAFKAGGVCPPCMDGPYRVRCLYLFGNKVPDPSNYHAGFEKFLLDALCAVDALPGDTAREHIGSSYSREITPGKWGVVVTIERVLEDGIPAPTDNRKAVGRFRTRRRKTN